MTFICPNHGRVEVCLAWFRSADSKLHLGGLCPQCNLVLKWLPKDMKGAPSREIVYRVGCLATQRLPVEAQ